VKFLPVRKAHVVRFVTWTCDCRSPHWAWHCCSRARAPRSPPGRANGTIAWPTRDFEGIDPTYGQVSYSIAGANPDGSGYLPITLNDVESPYQDVGASWSPDGNRLVLTSCGGGLFGCNDNAHLDLVNYDGSGRTPLVDNATGGTFSPDGTEVVYAADPDYASGVWTSLKRRRIDGTGTPVTIPTGCLFVGGPRWAHSAALGDKIFYSGGNCSTGHDGLFMANLDGSQPQLLVDLFTSTITDTKTFNGYDVSPDGSKLLYSYGECHQQPPGCWSDVYERNLATGSVRDVTNTPAVDAPEQTPSYSPDGRQMVFDAYVPGHLYMDLFVADLQDAQPRVQLTDNDVADDNPAWQPCVTGVTVRCEVPKDTDHDGHPNDHDLCPTVYDPGPQIDDDDDGKGNVCDPHECRHFDRFVFGDALGIDGCSLKPGDILLQRGSSAKANAESFLGGTYWTHAAIVIGYLDLDDQEPSLAGARECDDAGVARRYAAGDLEPDCELVIAEATPGDEDVAIRDIASSGSWDVDAGQSGMRDLNVLRFGALSENQRNDIANTIFDHLAIAGGAQLARSSEEWDAFSFSYSILPTATGPSSFYCSSLVAWAYAHSASEIDLSDRPLLEIDWP
jgi:Tol biopolymer transport system component